MPEGLRGLAARLRLGPGVGVWVNELGGVTFAFPEAGQYVKWLPHHPEFDVTAEAARLAWAGAYTSVPEVLEVGRDASAQWLRTRALPGRSAVDERWRAEPQPAVRALGRGLRALHDRLPVADCPFDWSVESRAARARKPEDRALIAQAPPIDRLVVCHGDACAPNTLIDDDGEVTGHVDLLRLGVADRWADLAVATYSLSWNYPGDWSDELLDAYGIEPDEERIAFYRRLWDAT